ncbi:MAG: TetR/AcrR family transcriptional regulator [Propionibacterium sp.]|nr:TetR/AcrR family transcriptional regulator [Propionibacterium sp.]
MTGPQLGREAIIEAATALFAERGVDGVSLGDIHRASGHRNRSATAYHFGGKEDLVKELITQVVEAHDAVRLERIRALYDDGGRPALRTLVTASLSPLLDDMTERPLRLRLRMFANVIADERYMGLTQDLMKELPGLSLSTTRILEHLDAVPAELRQERIVLATSFGLRTVADQARLMDSREPTRAPLDLETFGAQLPLLLEALLLAPAV